MNYAITWNSMAWHTHEVLSMHDLIFLIVEMMETKMFPLKAKYY